MQMDRLAVRLTRNIAFAAGNVYAVWLHRQESPCHVNSLGLLFTGERERVVLEIEGASG